MNGKSRTGFFLSFKITAFLFLVCVVCRAEVTLPSVLSNNAVLQQKSKVLLWGKAKPLAEVSITTSWNGKKYRTNSNEKGDFSQTVQTPVAGGPYHILFNDGQEKRLDNILIGEVWFCSGQSNMAVTMSGYKNQPILNAVNIIETAANNQISIFTTKETTSDVPMADCTGAWKTASPEVVKRTSAVAYQFAKMLQDSLQVPIGIIVSSVGGTPIRAWMSSESLANLPDAMGLAPRNPSQNPSQLFNAMIAPLVKFRAKGFLWYQGEADRTRTEQYRNMITAMIKDWRIKLNDINMPFYLVEIAPWLYQADKELFAPYFREMQLSLPKKIKNVGVVTTTDVGSDQSIHPPDKTTVAKRLGNLALAKTYGSNKVSYLIPQLAKIKITEDKIQLSFSNVESGLKLIPVEADSFEIAGEDKVFHKANCKVTGTKEIEVWSKDVAQPVAVRYGFKNYFKASLFTLQDTPVPAFRTDAW